jgi:hypothetical protein
MRRVFLVVASLAVRGQSLITLDIGSGAAQWNGSGRNLSSYRIEFRLENVQPSTTVLSNGGGVGNLNCRTDPDGFLTCAQGGDGTPDGIPGPQLPTGQDVRARFQRDGSGLTYTFEAWSGDCSHYYQRKFRITNGGSLPLSGTWTVGPAVNVGFLRGYSELDTAGDCPVDAPSAAADLFDFLFEGNSTKDRSGNHYTLSIPGLKSGASCGVAPCFAVSASYPPSASISGWTTTKPVFIAGTPFQLSGANSFSSSYPGTGAPASYQWSQIDGPAQATISGDAVATITAPEPGQYMFQLTVGDTTANTGSVSQIVGVVLTGSANTVIQTNPEFTLALGEVAPLGSSGWPWYDATVSADVDLLSPLMRAPPTVRPDSGTLFAPVGPGAPNLINGQGQIQAQQYGGVWWQGNRTNFTQADVGGRIALIWDADGNKTNQGRRVLYISQVIDTTHIVSSDYYLPEPAAAFSNAQGLSWGRLGADYGPYNSSDQSSFILNFYEAGLGVGRLYAATGLSTYRDQFHAFCDNWWRWALNSGYASPIPRNSGLHFMIACAEDRSYRAPPNLWQGIARVTQSMAGYVPTVAGGKPAYNPTSQVVKGAPDVREMSYILRPTALLARTYGRRGGNPSPWCGYLANQLRNYWIADAAAPANAPSPNYAYWEENLFANNVSYVAASIPAGDPNGHFGTSPWRSAGLPALALIYSYYAVSEAEPCADSTLANALFNPADGTGLIPSVANYIWDYGRAPDGGVFYAEGYATDTGNMLGWTVYNAFPSNGSISVTSGSAAVVGSGSYFMAQFGPCDGSTQIAIESANYPVAGCPDNTHLTLGSPYTGATRNVYTYGNPATIAVTQGSTQVVGTGTKFTVLFAPCDGSTFIGIVGNQNQYTDRRVYQVISCADDQHLTINLGYAGPTESGLNVFSRARAAHQDCGPLSLSRHCEPDQYDGRNLSADTGASAAWLYTQTGSASWKARAQYYANKTFGGAASGSGGLGPPSGSCSYSRPGTISVSAGSMMVTGSGTQFRQQFACDGTDRLTIGDATGGFAWARFPGLEPTFYTVNVQSCPSDTSLALASPYPGSGGSDISMFYNPADPQWQCADGGTGNLGEILPACQSTGPPCGIGALVPKYGKPLGMAAGAGDAPVMFADLAAPVAVVDVPLEMGSAAKARVTVAAAKGVIAEAVCSSSPCRVRIRGVQQEATVKIEYLSVAGAVLSQRESALREMVQTPESQRGKIKSCCAVNQ